VLVVVVSFAPTIRHHTSAFHNYPVFREQFLLVPYAYGLSPIIFFVIALAFLPSDDSPRVFVIIHPGVYIDVHSI